MHENIISKLKENMISRSLDVRCLQNQGQKQLEIKQSTYSSVGSRGGHSSHNKNFGYISMHFGIFFGSREGANSYFVSWGPPPPFRNTGSAPVLTENICL